MTTERRKGLLHTGRIRSGDPGGTQRRRATSVLTDHFRSFVSRIAPGKLWISSLETPVVQHCNLRCSGCDHAAPLLPMSCLSPDQLKLDLGELSPHVRAGEFRLAGGEPLLHPNLGGLIEAVRQSHIAPRITLVTNGLLIHRLDPAIWRSLDRLWVSCYPGVRTGLPQEEIQRRCEEHRVEFTPVFVDQFQQVLRNTYEGDEGRVRATFLGCHRAQKWRCFTILNGHFFRCAVAPQTKPRLAMAGQDYPGYQLDGLDIRNPTNLRGRLKGYAFSRQPLGACHYCRGSAGKMVQHSQRREVGTADLE